MLKRIALYLKEMFPPHHMLPSLLMALSFFCAMARFHHFTLTLSAIPVLATISLLVFVLTLRVMDEFKDYEDDLVNFPERPLPSGRVKHADLRVLLAIVILSAFPLNLHNKAIFIAAMGVLGYSFLMFRWFFMKERIRSSLPLALYTHNPIVYIYFAYLFVAYVQMDSGYSLLSVFIIIPLGLSMTNWEISRKIRLSENESSYTTYSKVWGRKKAILIALTMQLTVLACTAIFLFVTGSPWTLTASFAALYCLIASKYITFMRIETDSGGKWDKIIPLRKYGELQGLLLQLTFIAAYFAG
ncbi:MAG: UbiA family prenyltransferase [Oligoflexales bacterium]|nr:UbiA family prenyltransferase [Oligoflexales bacterium]